MNFLKNKLSAGTILFILVFGVFIYLYVTDFFGDRGHLGKKENGGGGLSIFQDERGEATPREPIAAVPGPISPDRDASISFVVKNIENLSPVAPVLGGSWHPVRFWFVDDLHFYVEYEDGHIAREILIAKNNGNYEVTGYFEAGENGWNLMRGEDPYFGESSELYEYDEGMGKWVQRN